MVPWVSLTMYGSEVVIPIVIPCMCLIVIMATPLLLLVSLEFNRDTLSEAPIPFEIVRWSGGGGVVVKGILDKTTHN
jgi:hypothetical protein